jgi:hypothetical protein
MIDISKKYVLLFAKCLKMYSFFAFAFKVCKKCYYDPKNVLWKISIWVMCIKKMLNFMLISNSLCTIQIVISGKVKRKTNIKGINRSFELRGESSLNRFVMTNWRLGNFFYFTLKGFHHKISKKPKDAA